MQHKVAGLWSSVHEPQSLTMADDGVEEVRCKTIGDNSSSSSNNESIVSSLLRKASSFRDELCVGSVSGGLEQKIQELRAGKEASELAKCCSPCDNDQESPIDFSVKRRTSFSGSLTDDSQTSSSSPGHMTDYNTMSPSAEPGGAHDSPSPDPLEHRLHNQEKGVPSLTMPHVLNNLDFFPGLASNLLANGSAMTSFSHLVLKEPRHTKSNRPFKAYPKDALQMPLGLFGLPGMTPTALQQGMDLGLLMGMASDELLNIYHQQIQLVRDSKFPGRGMKIPCNGKQMHHHYQHEKGYHSSPATTAINTSPPLSPPDQLRAATTPGSMAGHGSSSSASINASLVSSTSSFALSNSSRKRPSSLPDEQKDAAYWERRRKNNDAAKRSRDARRAKEDEIAMRAALLEQENLKLRVEVAALKTETERLRCMLYSN